MVTPDDNLEKLANLSVLEKLAAPSPLLSGGDALLEDGEKRKRKTENVGAHKLI
jgi:hypothetical protein